MYEIAGAVAASTGLQAFDPQLDAIVQMSNLDRAVEAYEKTARIVGL